ncbi:MAG TPA: HlyD family secretion protein, partial [Candidatus Binatia bacterium]|nr:HlyD family secretion protein [Candidatus Binatia bacterium]
MIELDDGLPLGAKDGVSQREPEALDAPAELRRERHEALRRGPLVAPDLNGDQSKDQPAPKPPPGPRGRGFFRRRPLRIVAVVLLVSLVVTLNIPLWDYLQSYESTDNAQIDGHIDLVSSRIDGTVVHVSAENNQTVRAGELLVEIDPRDYDVAVVNMRANLAQAEAQVKAAQADYETALSKLRASEATSTKAQRDAARYEDLFKQDVASRVQYEEYLRVAQVAVATVGADRAAATSAHNTIASRQAAVQAAKAALAQALLNLSYTRIYAPAGGIVDKKTVELGQRIQPGQTLMAVVETEDIWVTANFKETQLACMRPGQNVTIRVDTFGRDYRGYVENL